MICSWERNYCQKNIGDLSLPYINNYSMEMEVRYAGHSFLLQKKSRGLCLSYVKRSQIWLVSVDRDHISCNEKHIIGIYPKLGFYSNRSY